MLEYQSAFRSFSQYSDRSVLVSAAISMKRSCVMPLASTANRDFFHLLSLSQSLTKMNVSETMRGKVNVNSLFVHTSFVSISSEISGNAFVRFYSERFAEQCDEMTVRKVKSRFYFHLNISVGVYFVFRYQR